MNIKKFAAIVISIIAVLMLTACTTGSSEGKDVASGTSEPSAVGDVAPSSSPTEKPVLKTVPWGKDDFTKLLPECTFGAVTQITSGDGACLVLAEQIEEQEAVSYMDKLSQAGFSCSDASADLHTAGRVYSKSGVSVTVVYTAGMMTLMIQK